MTRFLPLLLLLLLVPSPALAGPAADRILATAAEGGSAEWDAAVRLVLLANFDLDGSGSLDKAPEVEAIPCATWTALDTRTREKWAAGFRVTYGFPPDRIWVGDTLGFAGEVRVIADQRQEACASGLAAETAARPPHVEVALAAPGQGGLEAWDLAVRPILIGAYDTDGDGALDSTEEIAAIPCQTFDALDVRVRENEAAGLRAAYGIQGDESWWGGRLGFAEELRAGLDMRLVSCASAPPPAPAAVGRPGADPRAEQIRALAEPPGEDGWDAAVARLLLGSWDADGSGRLDRESELADVPCAVWDEIDAGVRKRWKHGLRQTYGFVGGYIWVGDALGLDERVRVRADSLLAGCGLQR